MLSPAHQVSRRSAEMLFQIVQQGVNPWPLVHASLWMSSVHELLKAYGLWALFLGITLQCSGIPLPSETMLVSAALYAGSTHRLGIGSVMLVAATAATVGGVSVKLQVVW